MASTFSDLKGDDRRGRPGAIVFELWREVSFVLVMRSFKSAGVSYLVRSNLGVYYWQAKIGGKSRRGSLETKSKSVAKTRLRGYMDAARARLEGESVEGLETLGDWLAEWLRREKARPSIKPGTKQDYEKKAKAIEGCEVMAKSFRLVSSGDCREWWSSLCDEVGAITANARLRVFKAVIKLALDETGRMDDPSKGLNRKPVKKRVRTMPTAETVRAVAETIRAQGKRHSRECAAMVEFAAYSGMRPAEVAAVRGEDISGDWLAVRGGEDGTKNHEERLVPINRALRSVIEREGFDEREGRLFAIKSPTRALRAACARLGVDSVTPYTLRHFFATSCMEAGIDVATVADWMGHKDGGVLLLKTYTHVRRAHSLREAERLDFG